MSTTSSYRTRQESTAATVNALLAAARDAGIPDDVRKKIVEDTDTDVFSLRILPEKTLVATAPRDGKATLHGVFAKTAKSKKAPPL